MTEVEGQLSTLKHCDHVCLIFDHHPDDQLTVAVFLGDRSIHIAAEWSVAGIRRPRIASGVEP